MAETLVDVFVCGAGPVGLLVSYQLARSGLTTYTIDREDKSALEYPMYGRACTLYPRTIEMLDQLDLLEEFAQVGFVARDSLTFKDGKRVHGRGFDFMTRIYNTFTDYLLNIRLKYSEDILLAALEKAGGRVHVGTSLKNFTVDESLDDYKVSIQVERPDGTEAKFRAKYIVGADGGKSSVRHIAGIPFEGENTADRWIRLDAVVETNMPSARSAVAAIESPTHGHILWCPVDHGRVRIGFVVSQELYDRCGGHFTEEVVKAEAAKALAPFTIKFVTVDWWSLYGIGQRVAKTFQHKERVLLAGDSGHTHSSGAAQGMNTGIHDAVNLGWKLCGVLRGWYKPDLLATYSPERRAVAQHLINVDKSLAALMSGHVPEGYAGDLRGGNVNQMLEDVFESSAEFTLGLGVSYSQDGLLNKEAHAGIIRPGYRGPDVLVNKPGSRLPTRLYELTKNDGRFWVIVFAGFPGHTSRKLRLLDSHADRPDSFINRSTTALGLLTVIAGPGTQAEEVLGIKTFGRAYYDVDHAAHFRYGLTDVEGGIIVLRPDGILGFAADLDQGELIEEYFKAIAAQWPEIPKPKSLVSKTTKVGNQAGKHGPVGSFFNELSSSRALVH